MKSKFFFQLIFIIFLGIVFIKLIPFERYPDYKFLEFRIIGQDFSIQKLPHNEIFKILDKMLPNLSYNNEIHKTPNELYRILFYLITSLSIFTFLWLQIKFRQNEIKNNAIFFISLIFPSSIFSITTPSPEALFTITSIFVTTNINFYKINSLTNIKILPFILLCYFFDYGNSLIFTFFLILYLLILILRHQCSFKIFLFILFIIILTFQHFGHNFLTLLAEILQLKKLDEVTQRILDLQLEKNNLTETFLRYMYFFTTLFTLTLPSKTFAIFSSFFFLCIIIKYSFNIFSKKNHLEKFKRKFFQAHNQIILASLLIFPFCVSSTLPNHAFAKYYLFLLPLFIKILLLFFEEKKLMVTIIMFSFFSILEQHILMEI